MKSLSTPDVTPAQLVAIVGSILAVIVAFGLDLSQDKQDSIIQLVTILAPLIVGGDAVIRHGRSRAMVVPPKGEVLDDDHGN